MTDPTRRPAARWPRILPALIATLLVMSGPGGGAAAAQEIDDTPTREALFNKAEAAEVSQRLRAEPRLLRSFATCPADTFERERPFWRRLAAPKEPSERTCAQHPAACYDLCVGWANGPACFRLAEAYTHHSLDVPDALDKERFYALACASGFPAGCTNRAAGVRNGRYAGDPLRETSLATQHACEYRSFLIDCDRRGAWGCAMLGQAYQRGEGVASQAQRARAAFEASCAIDPKFAACDFAKRRLSEMEAASAPATEPAGSDD
jgi:hypothetical protein